MIAYCPPGWKPLIELIFDLAGETTEVVEHSLLEEHVLLIAEDAPRPAETFGWPVLSIAPTLPEFLFDVYRGLALRPASLIGGTI